MEDNELVKGIVSGNERLLRTFFNRYVSRLTLYVEKRVSNKDDAEELVEDILLETIEALRDFSFRCGLYTFIISIAKHRIVDFYRRRKVAQFVFSHSPYLENIVAVLTTPEDQLGTTLLKTRIEKTFAGLSPSYRRILLLKYVEEYSVAKIAKTLNMTFKSVESKLFRARKAFVNVYAKTY